MLFKMRKLLFKMDVFEKSDIAKKFIVIQFMDQTLKKLMAI